MNEADYAEEYKRRLEQYHPRSSMYQRTLDQESGSELDEYKRRLRLRGVIAEDQPDPTRSKMQWNEETQSYVRVRVDVDPYAVDRGEG